MSYKFFLLSAIFFLSITSNAFASAGYECELKVGAPGNTLVEKVILKDLFDLNGKKLGDYSLRTRMSGHSGFVFVEFIDERFSNPAEDYSSLVLNNSSLILGRHFNRTADEHVSLWCERS